MRTAILFAATLALAGLGAGPASTQEPTPPDVEATTERLRECLARSADDVDAERCLGTTMPECLARPGGESTAGAIGCSDAEAQAWDSILNEAYAEARLRVPSAADSLQRAQRAWIPYRDAACAVWVDVFEGGSLGRQIAVDCIREQTGRRALEVLRVLGSGAP